MAAHSPKPYARNARFASLLQEEIAGWLHTEAEAPWNTLCTVTRTDVSPDLREASVYVLVHEDESPETADAAVAYLNEEAGRLRGRLGRQLRVRRVPRLRFVYDHAYAEAARVEGLLYRLREEGELGDDPDAGEGDA